MQLCKEKQIVAMRFILPLIMLLFVLMVSVPAIAANYVKPAEFKQWLDGKRDMVIVDVQPAAEFSQHHFKDAIETNAFPGKNDEEKMRLDRTLPVINASESAVVIVCPRGGGGARNAYEYLKSKGVVEQRLYILEKGIEGIQRRLLGEVLIRFLERRLRLCCV